MVKWERMTYMVFDCPDPTVKDKPFSVRYDALRQLLSDGMSSPFDISILSHLSLGKHFLRLAEYKVATCREDVEAVSCGLFIYYAIFDQRVIL